MRRFIASCVAGLLTIACTGDPSPEDVSPTSSDRASVAPDEGYGPARLAGRMTNPDITESSGLAASASRPGTFWTHNDSGERPVIFCLRADGGSCGVVNISSAGIFDWEDMARGPGPAPGVDHLYIGDIGDNAHVRDSIVVYRIPEPRSTGVAEATEIVLTFPDGPHDAETLMAHPHTGDLYVISKGDAPVVYVARAPLSSRMVLEVAGKAPSPGFLPGPTGGDISPDGSRVVLSLYTGAQELVLPPGARFDSIWKQEPMDISLPAVAQREAIAYALDGRSIISTSEGPGGPVHRVSRR